MSNVELTRAIMGARRPVGFVAMLDTAVKNTKFMGGS
jgi:hypothetical protein